MKKPKNKQKNNQAAATAGAPESPVTLAQVRQMIKPREMINPRAVPSRVGGVRVRFIETPIGITETTLSPETVGIAREKLLNQQRHERTARIQDYKAMMEIMKKRGVQGLSAGSVGAPVQRAPGGAMLAPAAAPLQIFAEGDSWFDYPVPFFGGGIIPRLENRLGVPILNLAKAGDEVRFMLGVEERKIIEKQLREGCPASDPWDVLLFSGGGNDIVDNPMALWVRDFDPAVPVAQLIHQSRFDSALALVQAGYEDLITLRNKLSPSTQLVFHAYDYAFPDGRGVCHLGPWLKPTFDLRKFPSLSGSSARFEVVKEMLSQFAAMLTSLQTTHTGVTFVNGQNTLPLNPSSWHNELHPSREGFNKFADLFHAKLKALFPSRVL